MSIRLHVEVSGSGPVLCLLHGFGGSARNFRPQARAFKDTHRVVTFDARGHARSEAPTGAAAYTIDAFTQDIGDVLDGAGAEVAVLGGLSMGAALALEFALRHPERVSALVLASFPPSGTRERWALPFAEALGAEGLEAAGSRFVWGGDRFDAPAAALIRQGFLQHSAAALSATLRQVLGEISSPGFFTADRLRHLDVPVLFVAGTRDAPSLAASEAIVGAFPKGRLARLDAGHVVNLESPVEFNATLREFLNEVAGS